jgi:hypothetical protein
MAWTSDRATAERFSTGGLRGREPGRVWTAVVPPGALLAQISGRSESEYVVDPENLEIERAGAA